MQWSPGGAKVELHGFLRKRKGQRTFQTSAQLSTRMQHLILQDLKPITGEEGFDS